MRESPQSQSLSSRQAQKKQLSNRARRVMEMRESPQSQSLSYRIHTRAQLGVCCMRSAAAGLGRRHWNFWYGRRGDFCTQGSLNAAMYSGRLAAEELSEDLSMVLA